MIGVQVLLFAALAQLVVGRNGVDLSIATTLSDWQCLVGEENVTYSIIRLYRNVGEVDANAVTSLQYATKVGITDLGGYMFPCVPNSPYSASKNITCPSAAEQIQSTLDMLHAGGIGFQGEADASAYSVLLNRLWVDIEDDVPAKYYDADPEVNQAFIAEYVAELNQRSIAVGIYVNKNGWQNIMANVEDYAQYPLWYPKYDGIDSMDFFVPFGGWTECQIKQTAGDSGLCKLSQVDSDYSLDAK